MAKMVQDKGVYCKRGLSLTPQVMVFGARSRESHAVSHSTPPVSNGLESQIIIDNRQWEKLMF